MSSTTEKTVFVKNANCYINNQKLWDAGIDANISLAELNDIKDICDIETISFNTAQYDSLLTANGIKYLLKKGNGLLLVYRHEGHPIGYAQILFKRNSAKIRFYSLAVLPQWQGKGIANLLFKSVETTCLMVGGDTVLLEIREDNKVLRYRYNKFGYVEFAVIPGYYPDGCAAIKMQRILR